MWLEKALQAFYILFTLTWNLARGVEYSDPDLTDAMDCFLHERVDQYQGEVK